MWLRLPRWLEAVLSIDGTLNKKEQQKRAVFFAFNFIGLFFALTNTAASASLYESRPVSLMGGVCYFAAVGIALGNVFLKRQLTTRVVVTVTYTIVAGILLIDVTLRTLGMSVWATLVLMVDLLLVMQVPQRYTVGLVLLTIAWLIVMATEEGFRFGVFDLPGLVPQEGEHGRKAHFTHDCAELPCASDTGQQLIHALAVFVLDFVVTRGFARGLLKEQASMERTINAVQEIAALLAGYDVEQVAELLKAHEGDLPEGMTEALRNLEENLRKYRPYLPAALFEEDEVDGVQHTSVAPPGLDSKTATIVFTDIRASTSIWEDSPEGMSAGLQIHNTVIREVMQVFGGYEVKTIGDAFMIAFASTYDGVAFGLRVQERLFEADWPASLLEDASICSRQGSLWGGLTVRIGVNTGPVAIEQNTLTGRTDYLGHTVNVASRLESTCTPGAVAVPSDLWTSVSESCSGVASVSEAVHLKGVTASMLVCYMWPASLRGRLDTPLREFSPMSSRSANRHATLSTCSSSALLCTSVLAVSTRQTSGTVGVAQLAVDVGQNIAFHQMSSRLTTLTTALEQSGGTLVTLLGNCVCVGWNVSRSAPAHTENAIRFVQRMSVKPVNGVGLASGLVQHGDVGARSQRFVTVMGNVVRRSWTLCEEAVRDGVVCLYEPPEGTTLPSALEDVLVQHKGCYRVLEAQDNRECTNVF